MKPGAVFRPAYLLRNRTRHLWPAKFDSLSPGDRRPYLFDDSSFSLTQQESLVVPTRLKDSAPGIQRKPDAEEEIAPGDIKHRLPPLGKSLLQTNPSSHSQLYKPGYLPISTTHRDWFKPWKTESVTCHGDESFHSGYVPGRRAAPRGHLGHVEFVSQNQSDTQAPRWSQVLSSGPDKSGQGIIQSTQHLPREMAPGWPMTCAYQEPSQSKHQLSITETKSTVKSNEATAPRVKCLSFPVKRAFQVKFQTKLTSKQLSQDCKTQPQRHYGSKEKPLGSQVLSEDQTATRINYTPLFTGRVKLYKPKANSMKLEASNFSAKHGKSVRPAPEPWLQKENTWMRRLPG